MRLYKAGVIKSPQVGRNVAVTEYWDPRVNEPRTVAKFSKGERLAGQRFKCQPVGEEPERWLDEAHDDVASTRVSLSTATPVSGGHAVVLPVQRFVSPVVREVSVHLALAGAKTTLLLRLDRTIELPPAYAEMLRQYQRLGPALLRVSPGAVGVVRVKTDLCGDSTLS